ncbi:MAG TPA: hypothetical protein VGO34_16500, partial [Alphaproteobacteria bacterium]
MAEKRVDKPFSRAHLLAMPTFRPPHAPSRRARYGTWAVLPLAAALLAGNILAAQAQTPAKPPATVSPPTPTKPAPAKPAPAAPQAQAPAAAPAPTMNIDEHNADYAACLALAAQNPDAAIARAKSWWESGANFAARHCLGIALAQKQQYVQAGKIFEDLAADGQQPVAPLKADLYGQAGQAYYLAGLNDRAIGAFDRALALKPRDPDLLIDRAVARDDADKHFEAIDDLNVAIEEAPDRAEAWLYRAAAYRHV